MDDTQVLLDSFLSRELPLTSNRSNRRKFLLHKVIVEKLSRDNNFLLFRDMIINNVDKLRSESVSPIHKTWLDRWEDSINRGLIGVVELSLQTWDEYNMDDGSDMRQMSPLMGILTDEERSRVFSIPIPSQIRG